MAVTNGACAAELTDATGQWRYVLENDGAVITGYMEEPSDDLVIPGEVDVYPVTGIGENTFRLCLSITGVTIPGSVHAIGDFAFELCENLADLTISDGVTSIGAQAFCSCHALTAVSIPDSVNSIGDYAFMECVNLTSVIIPNSVTSIGEWAFDESEELTLTVAEGSYAQQYAKENGIPYTYTATPDNPAEVAEGKGVCCRRTMDV